MPTPVPDSLHPSVCYSDTLVAQAAIQVRVQLTAQNMQAAVCYSLTHSTRAAVTNLVQVMVEEAPPLTVPPQPGVQDQL